MFVCVKFGIAYANWVIHVFPRDLHLCWFVYMGALSWELLLYPQLHREAVYIATNDFSMHFNKLILLTDTQIAYSEAVITARLIVSINLSLLDFGACPLIRIKNVARGIWILQSYSVATLEKFRLSQEIWRVAKTVHFCIISNDKALCGFLTLFYSLFYIHC